MLSKYLGCFREFKKHVTNLLYLLIIIITKINDMKYTANKSSQGRMLGVKQVARLKQSIHESIFERTQFASHEFGHENVNDTYRLSKDFHEHWTINQCTS